MALSHYLLTYSYSKLRHYFSRCPYARLVLGLAPCSPPLYDAVSFFDSVPILFFSPYP